MTLLGIGYEQRGQNEEALKHWRSAESILPAESPLKSRLTEMIGQVVQKPVVDSKTTQAISVEVHLSEELKNSIRGGSTLFVMLKNEDLKPPISVIKTNVLNFPAKIELSDDNSMLQGVSIENFNSVYAMARISLRGSPLPSRGDLEGHSQNFDPKKTEKISILIEQLVE